MQQLERLEIPEMIKAIEADSKYRILQRLNFDDVLHPNDIEISFDYQVGLVLDVETTGVDPRRDAVIELAARTFWADKGEIVALSDPVAWLEDPGEPLSREISRLTGLTDPNLAGKSIDEDAFAHLFLGADVVIAHNAQFDRKFIEKRFPKLAGRPWACSCQEVDWRSHGFDGRGLGWLLAQCGLFSGHGAHRAGADVDAVIALLRHRLPTGETALAELVTTARRKTWLVRAQGAHFDVKGALKDRGYRWFAADGVWQREIELEMRDEEEVLAAARIRA